VAIGLVDKVVEANLLMQTVTDFAKQIAKRSPLAVKIAKKAINTGLDVCLSDGLMIERKSLIQLFSEGDVLEGASAFLEKRKPNFINK
jgi:enoyl-CoA hydratase/carnithine racemase